MKQQGEFALSFWCHIPLVREGGKLIRTPKEAADEMAEFRDAAQELFGGLYLNTRNRLLDKRIIAVGMTNACLIQPKEVFRQGVILLAESIVLFHTHPSGDPTPSAEDLRITRKMVQSGQILGIQVIDHIIIGRLGVDRPLDFISMRESGLCEFNRG